MTLVKSPISSERIRQHAYLPAKLAELSHINPEKAVLLLQDWGEGKKTIKKLWEEITAHVDDSTA